MRTLLGKAGLAILAIGSGFSQSAAGQPRFEVASVKPGPPDGIGSMNGGPLPVGPFNQTSHDPGRITWTNVRLGRVIQVAYDFPIDRISGPDWLFHDVVTIVAPVPAGTSVGDFRLMVQNLLAERFKLAVHRETKQVSGYTLEVARNGPKLKESGKDSAGETKSENRRDEACRGCNNIVVQDQNGFPAPRPGNPVFLPGAGFSATIAVNGKNRASILNGGTKAIADYLGNAIGSPVEDRTGLTGIYDVHLEFVPGPSGTEPTATDAAAEPGTGIFDAVQSQLGLKLTPQKVPVETIVIDHVEKVPSEN